MKIATTVTTLKTFYLAFMLLVPLFIAAAQEEVSELTTKNPSVAEVFDDLLAQLALATDSTKSQSGFGNQINTGKSQGNPNFKPKPDKLKDLEQQAQALQKDYFAQLKDIEKAYLNKLQGIYAQMQALQNS